MKKSLRDNICWCIKQKKGLMLTEPSDNLCKAYLKKAEDSIASMNANFNAGVMDWAKLDRILRGYKE